MLECTCHQRMCLAKLGTFREKMLPRAVAILESIAVPEVAIGFEDAGKPGDDSQN